MHVLQLVTTPSWRSHFHSRKCTSLVQAFLSKPAGTLLWVWRWCLLGELCAPSNSRNIFKLPKSESSKGMLLLQCMICRKTVEIVSSPCLSGTGPALTLPVFPQWSPTYAHLVFLATLEEQKFPFRLLETSCSAFCRKKGNLHPLSLPSCSRGEQEVFLSLKLLFFLRPWKTK